MSVSSPIWITSVVSLKAFVAMFLTMFANWPKKNYFHSSILLPKWEKNTKNKRGHFLMLLCNLLRICHLFINNILKVLHIMGNCKNGISLIQLFPFIFDIRLLKVVWKTTLLMGNVLLIFIFFNKLEKIVTSHNLHVNIFSFLKFQIK